MVKVNESIIDRYINDMSQDLAVAMDEGNHKKASEIAMKMFALHNGQEAFFKSIQKRQITELMKETTAENVATFNTKWKMAAGIISGLVQIGAGGMGVGGTVVGAVGTGTAAAIGKGFAGVAQTFSYAGNGTDSVANALFTPTEGKRVELNSREQEQRTEREDIKNGEESAKNLARQMAEQIKEKRRSEESAKGAILRAN